MPIDLGINAPNIATGWAGPPQLSAPSIGTLVGEILRNKLLRDKMTGESISDAIKNVREERQGQAYTDQLRAAGLLPEGELGGPFGAKYATSLAKMIQDRQEAESLAKYRDILGDTAQRRTQLSEDWADTAADEPETFTDDQGREWRKTRSGWTLIPKYGQPNQMPREAEAETEAEKAYRAAQETEGAARVKAREMEQRHGGAPTKEGFPGSRDPERQAFLKNKYLRELQDEQRAVEEQERLKKQYPRFQNIPPSAGGMGGGMGGGAVRTDRPRADQGAAVNTPQVGDTRVVNGVTYQWDGNGWLPALKQ